MSHVLCNRCKRLMVPRVIFSRSGSRPVGMEGWRRETDFQLLSVLPVGALGCSR